MTKSGSPFLKQDTETTKASKVDESGKEDESKESKAKLMINSLNYLNFILSESTEQRNQQQLQELQEEQHQGGDKTDVSKKNQLVDEHKIVYADDEIALLNANMNMLDNKLNEDSSKQLTSEEQFNQAFLLNTNKKLINLLETSKYLNYIDDEHSSDVNPESRTVAAAEAAVVAGTQDQEGGDSFIITQLDVYDETTTSSILSKIQLDTCQIDKQKLTHNQNYDKPKTKKSKSAKKTVANNQQPPVVDQESNSFDLTIRSIKSGEDNNNKQKDNEDQELYAMVKDMANFKWPDTLNSASSAATLRSSILIDNTIGLYDDRAIMMAQQESDLIMIEPKERKSRKKDKKTKYVSKTRSPSRARRKHHDYDEYDECGIKPTVRFRSVSRSALKEDGRQARLSMMPMSASASRDQSCSSSVKIINILGKDIIKYPTFLEREIKIKKHFYPLGLTSVDCQVDEGINGSVILKIDDNSACSRDARLKVGDYLLSVNNEQMRNLTNSSARSILSRASLTSKDVVIIYIPLVDAIKFKEHLRKHCLLPGGSMKQQGGSRQHSADARQRTKNLYSSSSSSICSSLFSSTSISSLSKLSPTCSSMSELECNKQRRRYACSTCSLTSSNLSLSSNSRENKDTTTTNKTSDSGGSKAAKSEHKTASTSSSSFLKYLTKSGSKSSPKPSGIESSKSATIDFARNTGESKKDSKTSKSSEKSKLNESISTKTGHEEKQHIGKSATLGSHIRSLSSNNREISKKSYHCCHHCTHCHHLNKTHHHQHGEHHHKRHHHDHHRSHHHHRHLDHHQHHHSDKRQSHSHHHHHSSHQHHKTHAHCEFCSDLVDSKTNKKHQKRHHHHHSHHHRKELLDKQPTESIKSSHKKTTTVLVHDEELERSGRSSSLREVSDLISQTSSFVTNNSSSFVVASSTVGLSDLGVPMNEAMTSSLWGRPRIVVLNREEGKSLGISIVGGKLDVCSSSAASPSQQQSSLNTSPQPTSFISGIFIKHVLDKSPAGLNGTLKTGDRILAVNEADLTNASHDKAVEAIRSATSPIRFTIQSLICINEPSPPKTVTDTPVKVDNTIIKKDSNVTSTSSTSEESSKTSSQTKVDSAASSPQVKKTENVEEFGDRVVTDQPNKYNYSLEDIKDKYNYLLDASANTNNSTGSFDATETNAVDEQTVPAAESSPVSGTSSSNREIFIFKLSRSFLGESLGLSLSGNVNLNKTSVFVCGIYANSIAHRHGLIKVGDQILEINGQSIYGRAHSNVTPLIKNVKELDVFMVVLRNPDNLNQMFKPLYIVNNSVPLKSSNRSSSASSPCSLSPPPELATGHNENMPTSLTVDSHKSTAVNLTQSSSNQSSFQTASNQSPSGGKILRKIMLRKGPTGFGIAISEDKHGRLIVRGLNPSGVAFQDGRMQVGDQIIIVNNLQVGSMKYDDIMTLLHETKEPVEFQVTKPEQMTNSSSVQNTTASSNSASGSTSPLTNATLKQQKQSGSKSQSEINSRKQSVTTVIPVNPRTDPIKVGEETWIEIERGKLGLGLSIVGGSDTQLAGIIIHDIYATGAASKDGRLAIGDQILKVNNADLTNATHEQALNALRQTSDIVKLLIMRSIQPTRSSSSVVDSSTQQQQSDQGQNSNGSSTPSNVLIDLMSSENEKYLNIMTIELTKKFGKGLGFSIIGRRDGSGVFISHIIDGGCAHKDGRLMVGDLILEVNSQDIRKMPYNDVAFLLKTLPQGRVVLKIGRFKTSASNSANASASQSLTSSQQGSKQPSRRNSIGASNNASSSATSSSTATVIPPSLSTPLARTDDALSTNTLTNEPADNSKLTTFKPCLKK